MRKVKISLLAQASYPELSKKYENVLTCPCSMHVGDVFVVDSSSRPESFCESAWETIAPFVEKLLQGEGHFYGDWMKNPYSALLSCNDGFRPMSMLLEAIDD